jgi:hypothetical protein
MKIPKRILAIAAPPMVATLPIRSPAYMGVPCPLGRIAVTITAGPPGYLPHEPSRHDDPGTELTVGDGGFSEKWNIHAKV